MFNKKNHSWYWYTFFALLFCLLLFAFARLFMKIVNKPDNIKRDKNAKKDGEWEALFI